MTKTTTVDDIRDNDHTREWWLKESIIASAVWWYRKKSSSIPHYQIKLFIGKRHCHCFAHIKEAWANVWRVVENQVIRDDKEQWFLTSKNRFVDRYEWMNIAIEFWQLLSPEKCEKDTMLFSEDLR